jgi:peptidoglycan/LPS O-acetylase OafA/YrhL
MSRTSTSAAVRLPQLDGLRTIAVLLVLAYHVARAHELPQLPGGFIGVDVFFVLSGFLITALLLREHAATGTIALRRFYVKRLWRLYPALILVSAVVAAVFAFVPGPFGLEPASPLEAVVALTYGMSWWSGLELTGGPYLLGLTWSLSVEEHFYLLWPLLLLAVLRRGGRVGSVAVIALLANAWTAWVAVGGADPDRMYFLPDTRFSQILTGCLLAAVLHRSPDLGRFRPAVSPAVAWGVLGALTVVVVLATRYDRWYWAGGMQLIGIGTALLIGHLVVHPDGRMAQLLRWGPLPVLGLWSYGIYLWHLPLMRLAMPVFDGSVAVTVLAGLAAIPVAAASYRWVEQPLMHRRTLRPVPALAAEPEAAEPARERELLRSAA